MAVRSKQLANAHLADAAAHDLYTVPTGFRTILKGVTIRSNAAAAQLVAVYVKEAGTIAFVWDYNLAAVGTNGDSALSVIWIVLDEGQVLGAQCGSASGAYLSFSGAELAL